MKTFTAVLVFAISLMSTSWANTAKDQHTQFKDVESLRDKIEAYENKRVGVSGEVEILDSNSFVIKGGGITDDRLVVVLGKGLDDQKKALIQKGAKVTVIGVVKEGNLSTAEKELGYTFDSKVKNDQAKVVNFLIAESIVPKAAD